MLCATWFSVVRPLWGDAGSCDWPSRQERRDRKDRRRDGRQVYIPPYADLGRGTREARPGDRR